MGVVLGFVCVGVVVANIIVRMRGESWRAFWLKTSCGVLFLIVGAWGLVCVNATAAQDSRSMAPLAAFLLAGLACGFIGDIALALKDLKPRMYEGLLLAGIGAFALGHVVYVVGLIRGYRISLPWIPLLACLGVAVLFVVLEGVLRLNFGKFKWAIAGYGCLLLMLPVMGFYAVGTTDSSTGSPLVQPFAMGIAGVCFLVSDLVLAWTYFGHKRNRGWQHALCYVFYYAAQFGIACSLFLMDVSLP